MTRTLMATASAFVLAMALGSAAHAIDFEDLAGAYVGNDGTSTATNTQTDDSNNTDSSTTTKTWTDSSTETKTWTDSSTNTKTETENEDSFNTDNSVEHEDSYNTDNSTYSKTNTYTKTENDTENEDSFNTEDSNNTDNSVEHEDSYNTEDSNNTDNSVEHEDSYNTSNKTEDSNNSDSSVNTKTVTLSSQDLDAHVTGTEVNFAKGDTQNGRLRTGDISYGGGAFANYAGVQTSSQNTGVGSINQAATSLAANASISFGTAP